MAHSAKALSVIVLLSAAQAFADRPDRPSIEVVTYKANGQLDTTYVLKSEYPNKPLTKVNSKGEKSLNINPGSLQEKGVYDALHANFNFDFACNYKEYEEFKSKHPKKEEWEIDQLFAEHYMAREKSLPRNSHCFANLLEKLLAANPCLKKQGVIQFHSMPLNGANVDDPTLVYDEKGREDLRRVVGIAVLGCPYENAKKEIWDKKHPCGFVRPWGVAGNYFIPSKWEAFVESCSAAYQSDQLKQLADAALNKAHSR